jgi:hypothetical protein
MKRLHVNLWCIGLALSAGVFGSVGCNDDGPAIPVLTGPVGPTQPPDAGGEDSGAAGSAMSQAGSGGSGQGGSGMGGSGTGVDAGGADAGDAG